MSRRISLVVLALVMASITAHAQVGAKDLRSRVLDHQRTMWRYQMNIAFQSMICNPFQPPLLGAQQMQIVYWQQLQTSGYLPPPLMPVVPTVPSVPVSVSGEDRRALSLPERVIFREAPGLRNVELARLVAHQRPELARQLLLHAIKEAGENSPVAQLARQELRKLDGQ